MKKNKKYIAIPLLLATSTCLAFTDGEFDDSDEFGDFYSDAEFISIATGTKKQLSRAPSVATVITAQQIKSIGANNIHQVIETVTGIHVYPSNFNRMNPSYSIRGLHTSQNPQVLVLVNGNRVHSNWTGAKWDLFDTGIEIVERIEIIKGPGSAVHGADAFSGVINIITKGFDGTKSQDIGARVGSFGTRSIWGNLSTNIDQTQLYFNGQLKKTDGDNNRLVVQDALYAMGLSAISNAPAPLDTRLETIDLHFGFKAQSLYGDLWYLRNDGGNGAGVAQVLSNNNDYTDSRSVTAKIGFKANINDKVTIDAFASYQSLEQDSVFTIFPAGMTLPRAFDSETGVPTEFTVFPDGVIGQPILIDDNYNIEVVTHYSGFKNHKLRTSFGYLRNEMEAQEFKNFGPLAQTFLEDFRDGTLTDVTGTDFVFSPNKNRDIYYASFQDEWGIAKDWELTAGVRYDKYSDFGSTINPRAALVWQARHDLTVKTLYGEAFRAPSIGELFAINNPVLLGNPNLDPEKINTFEVAFDYRPSFDWHVLFNVFSYKAKSLIIYTAQPDGSSQANNAAKQNGKGFEFEADWQVNGQLDLAIGIAMQDATNETTGHDISDAPQKMFDVALNWDVARDFKLHVKTHLIKDRVRLANDPRPSIDDYSWTNATANYLLNNQVSLSLSIRNLFNKAAYEPSDGQIPNDYPLQERGYWLSATYRFE